MNQEQIAGIARRLDAILEKHGERYADFVRRQKAERELLLENLDDDAVYVLGWEDLHRWLLDLRRRRRQQSRLLRRPTDLGASAGSDPVLLDGDATGLEEEQGFGFVLEALPSPGVVAPRVVSDSEHEPR